MNIEIKDKFKPFTRGGYEVLDIVVCDGVMYGLIIASHKYAGVSLHPNGKKYLNRDSPFDLISVDEASDD